MYLLQVQANINQEQEAREEKLTLQRPTADKG